MIITYDEAYEKRQKEMRSLLKQVRSRIRKDYGKKCLDFYIDCHVCKAYLSLDLLEDLYRDGDFRLMKHMGVKVKKLI